MEPTDTENPTPKQPIAVLRDQYGIVGQPLHNGTFEGGDSMNWHAHWLCLTRGERDAEGNKARLISYGEHFESPEYPGLYVRHPHPASTNNGFGAYCAGNWRGVESRDQMTGKLWLFAVTKATSALCRCLKQHMKRGMIFANNTIHNGADPLDYFFGNAPHKRFKLPDITFFDIWAMYVRGFRAWYLYPLLVAFDLHLLLGAISVRLSNDIDVISFFAKSRCSLILPTPISFIARLICPDKHLLVKIRKYWCGWRNQCGMADLYEEYCK